MKKITTATLMLCLGVWLAGCNTVRGIGQDVQRAGEVVENAVRK